MTAKRARTAAAEDGHSRARAALPEVCSLIRARTPINRACARVGVPRSSLYALTSADEEAALMLDEARAFAAEQDEGELRALIKVGAKTANVMLHLMERLYPDDYAPPPKRVEQSGPNGEPQQHEVKVTIEQATAGAAGEEPT